MIVPVRLFDGTIFDFDTKYIMYTSFSVDYHGNEVRLSALSTDFVGDYNLPHYSERSESEHDLVERAACVASHSLGLQIGCSPTTVELLTPEEAYIEIDNLENIFMKKFYLDYFTYTSYHKFRGVSPAKQFVAYYTMLVYGVCGKEALEVANSRDLVLTNLNFGEDEEMNKIKFTHFDQNVRDIMTKKNIQFPQIVTTTIGGFQLTNIPSL